MADFTPEQVTDLAEILGTNSDVLGDHLEFFESTITESDKARIVELMAEWETIDDTGDTISVEPTESNFGARKGYGARVSKLAQRIAALIQWPLVTGSRLVRA